MKLLDLLNNSRISEGNLVGEVNDASVTDNVLSVANNFGEDFSAMKCSYIRAVENEGNPYITAKLENPSKPDTKLFVIYPSGKQSDVTCLTVKPTGSREVRHFASLFKGKERKAFVGFYQNSLNNMRYSLENKEGYDQRDNPNAVLEVLKRFVMVSPEEKIAYDKYSQYIEGNKNKAILYSQGLRPSDNKSNPLVAAFANKLRFSAHGNQ